MEYKISRETHQLQRRRAKMEEKPHSFFFGLQGLSQPIKKGNNQENINLKLYFNNLVVF